MMKIYRLLVYITFVFATLTCRKISEEDFAVTPCFTIETIPVGCASDCKFQFRNCSEHASGFQWDFGDGTVVSSERDPVHYYTATGTYTVTLRVFRRTAVDSLKKTVTVNFGPKPVDFEVTSTAQPMLTHASIQFKNLSENAQEYRWDFGDQSEIDTTRNAEHRYNNAGTYTVTLKVIQNGQEAGQKSRIVQVGTFPTASGSFQIPDVDIFIESAVESADGGLIMAGYLKPSIGETDKGLLVKVGSDGTIVWSSQVALEPNEDFELEQLIQVQDGSYVSAGSSGEFVHFTENGELLTVKRIPQLNFSAVICPSFTSGKVLIGGSFEFYSVNLDGSGVQSVAVGLSTDFDFMKQSARNTLLMGGFTSIMALNQAYQPVFIHSSFASESLIGIDSDPAGTIVAYGRRSVSGFSPEGGPLWHRDQQNGIIKFLTATGDAGFYTILLDPPGTGWSFRKISTATNTLAFEVPAPITGTPVCFLGLRNGGYAVVSIPFGNASSNIYFLNPQLKL